MAAAENRYDRSSNRFVDAIRRLSRRPSNAAFPVSVGVVVVARPPKLPPVAIFSVSGIAWIALNQTGPREIILCANASQRKLKGMDHKIQ
jgi:hypothetical protein